MFYDLIIPMCLALFLLDYSYDKNMFLALFLLAYSSKKNMCLALFLLDYLYY